MITSFHTEKLIEYFCQSGSFFYIILDKQGHFIYANPLFQQQLNHASSDLYGQNLINFIIENDRERFSQSIQQCFQTTSPCHIAFAITNRNSLHVIPTRWEFSIYKNEDGVAEHVQAIGFVQAASAMTQEQPLAEMSDMMERYAAYEHSAEGLWMFETPEPIAVTTPPKEIIAIWESSAHLADCNDNTAKMYGFDKSEELIGTPMSQLVDFTDPFWKGYLEFFIVNGFKSTGVETREFDRYGNTVYFVNNIEGVIENGTLKRVWGTQQDITHKKRAEMKLQQSELFYRNLFANALDGILITDEQGTITFASPSITPILGYSTEEGIGKSTFEYVHPDDRELAAAAFKDELKDNAQLKFISVRLLTKSEQWLWCIIRGHNLMHNEHVKGMIIYFYDDTLRKETEAALIQSEQRFRRQANVLSNVTDVIVTLDMNRVVTSWNKVLEELSGIAASEAIGKFYRDVVDTAYYPYSREEVMDNITHNGIWKGEVSFAKPNGDIVHLLHTISIFYDGSDNPIGLLGIGKDITERRKAEQQLLKSEKFYRSMSYHSLDGIVMADANGKLIYSGPSVKKIAGYEPEELIGRTLFEFIHPDDMSIATDAFLLEIRKQSVQNYAFLRLKHANGDYIWCTVRAHNHLHTEDFNAVIIYFTNDFKRKEAEDMLRKSEQDFRNLIYNLKQGVILQDKNGIMTICNQAALDMLGVTEDHLHGKAAFHPAWNVTRENGENFPANQHPVSVALETLQTVKDVVMGVFRPVSNDRVWLLVNAEPVFDAEGQLLNVVCSFTDITEQKRLSGKLIEQEIQKQRLLTQATIDGQEKERLEIGKELHDNINQHLTTTRLYLEVAREKAAGEILEMINLSHKTLAGIITEIRSLSQSLVPPTLGDIGLIESVQELCDSLKRAHKFQIDFFARHFSEERLPGNVQLMIFRVTQEQVNNIIRHASAETISIKLQSDAENITLTISDDGHGFDTAHYKKGLGFKNIANRVGLFNGRVDIDTAPGKGCCLSVIIPLELILGD